MLQASTEWVFREVGAGENLRFDFIKCKNAKPPWNNKNNREVPVLIGQTKCQNLKPPVPGSNKRSLASTKLPIRLVYQLLHASRWTQIIEWCFMEWGKGLILGIGHLLHNPDTAIFTMRSGHRGGGGFEFPSRKYMYIRLLFFQTHNLFYSATGAEIGEHFFHAIPWALKCKTPCRWHRHCRFYIYIWLRPQRVAPDAPSPDTTGATT